MNGKRFEVGKTYEWADSRYDPITVTRRTDKSVWVDNGQSKWRMLVRLDGYDNEYVSDSSVPEKWRTTCSAKWEI